MQQSNQRTGCLQLLVNCEELIHFNVMRTDDNMLALVFSCSFFLFLFFSLFLCFFALFQFCVVHIHAYPSWIRNYIAFGDRAQKHLNCIAEDSQTKKSKKQIYFEK